MTTTSRPALDVNPDAFIASVMARLARGQAVRRSVPDGWLHIDRPLPFLCVYRHPAEAEASGVERLVATQAAHLSVSNDAKGSVAIRRLVTAVASSMADRFGAFLVVELWLSRDSTAFRVEAPATEPATTVSAIADALGHVDVLGRPAAVEIIDRPAPSPPRLPALLSADDQRRLGVLLVGIEVPAFFVDSGGASLPLVLRRLQRDLAVALQRGVFDFTSVQTSFEPQDFRALGPRRLLQATRRVDRALAEIGGDIDYLLAVTPVNVDAAWAEFRDGGCAADPTFHYRPLKVDPDLLKRSLYAVPLERVEDPTIAAIFRAKRHELDRQIDLLEDRDSAAFRYASLQLFGAVEPYLLELAEAVLDRVRHSAAIDDDPSVPGPSASLDSGAFAALADEELARYRHDDPELTTTATVRDDVPGVLVSDGDLLVGSRVTIPARRAAALVQHEIGTHVITEANGRGQSLQLLRIGLPGYEETQEALAVLAEFVAGGLTPQRLATLAARVVAVHRMIDGATFVDTVTELRDRHHFSAGRAFHVAMRVFRAGGLTKDAIYLRGLDRLLRYLAEGNPLDPLLVGKLAFEHVPIIEELQWRKIVTPARLRPRWLDLPDSADRLERFRRGVTVIDLASEIAS